MPKVLNVVKLHKKFASLTRSKESVQSLSSWIIHHKEFHEDIVNEWLIGVSKDYNPLVMFYVANEVIQNCGKKRVPEFREDFAKVLKKAVALERVKEIKDNVIRLITFWKERDIYDEQFSQELKSILNTTNIKVESDDEPSEEEVIARFKKETLIADLDKLKTAATDREEKEEILQYAEEPLKPDSCVALVQRECQDMIEKCEKYSKLIEETINLTCREVRMKRVVLEDLKDCCVFYSAQSRDVKEVANMFRIYGRKLKIMEKKVSEKKTSLENTEPNTSQCVPDTVSLSPNSISSYVSLSDNESTSVMERIAKISKDSPETSSQEIDGSTMEKSFFALLNQDKNAESKSLLSEASVTDQSTNELEENLQNSKDAIKELDSNVSTSEPCSLTHDKPTVKGNKQDLNDIDFLLDESYDCKRGNPKPQLKRKSEIVLKLKEKKVCTENKMTLNNSEPIKETIEIIIDESVIKREDYDVANFEKEKAVISEILIDKEENECISLEASSEKGNPLNDELQNMKGKEEDCVTILETPSQNNPPVINQEFSIIEATKDANQEFSIIEAAKDANQEFSIIEATKGDCVVILEASSQKEKTVLNDELLNIKNDENDGAMIVEADLPKDKTVFSDELTSKSINEDDCAISVDNFSQNDETICDDELNKKTDGNDYAMIVEAPLQNDEPPNKTSDENYCAMIVEAPLQNDEPPNKTSDENPILISTDTVSHLSLLDGIKDIPENDEQELSSTSHKELSFDSISIENKSDELLPNLKKIEDNLPFKTEAEPETASQCSKSLSIEATGDSNEILKPLHSPKDELKSDKPNLLENLQKVLKCICDNRLTELQTSEEPLLPLENYIAIYGALYCPEPDIKVVADVPSKPIQTTGTVFRQNEVVDMDCETDEES